MGSGATKYVRGVYFPAARLGRIDGYRLDDTDSAIGLYKYRLVLSDDGKMLGGIT